MLYQITVNPPTPLELLIKRNKCPTHTKHCIFFLSFMVKSLFLILSTTQHRLTCHTWAPLSHVFHTQEAKQCTYSHVFLTSPLEGVITVRPEVACCCWNFWCSVNIWEGLQFVFNVLSSAHYCSYTNCCVCVCVSVCVHMCVVLDTQRAIMRLFLKVESLQSAVLLPRCYKCAYQH